LADVEFGCGIGHVSRFGQHHKPAQFVNVHTVNDTLNESMSEDLAFYAWLAQWLCGQ
jgi:hypothetical protein